MKVFLDTNVLVSAVAARGLCADVLREILVSHNLVITPPLISELKTVLLDKIGIPMLQRDFPAPFLAGDIVVHPVGEQLIDQCGPVEGR